MEITINTNELWKKVKYYNELSSMYSELADKLTREIQIMENQNEE